MCRAARVATAVAVGACALVSMSGCSGARAASKPTASPALVASSVYPGAYRLPDEGLTRDPSFYKTISDRENQLITQCMQQRGFSYTPSVDSQTPQYPPDVYDVIDKDWASVYGYMTHEDVEWASQPHETNDTMAPMPDPTASAPQSASDNALMGVKPEKVIKSSTGRVISHYHPDGCFWIGTLAVEPHYVDSTELETEAFHANQESEQAVQQSPEYLAAQSQWSACMAAAGFTMKTPNDAPESYHTAVTAASITQALQDISCKNSTGFLKTWSRLLANAETKAYDKYPGLLETLEQQQDDAYANAVKGGK